MDQIRTFRQSSLRPLATVVVQAVTIFVLVCPTLLTGESSAAQDSQQDADDARARKLVQQLGASSLLERDRATRELAGLGMLAESALQAGLESNDAEIRDRCQIILRDVRTADFQSRIKRFKSDLDGTQGYGLPGFDQFVESFDNQPTSRALFVRMIEICPRLMYATAGDPKKLPAVIDEQVEREIYDGRITEQPAVTAALLYASSAENVTCSAASADAISYFVQSSRYLRFVQEDRQAQTRVALLDRWIRKNAQRIMPGDSIQLILDFGLKSGLSFVRESAINTNVAATDRMNAILAVAKLGDAADIPLLKDLFEAREVTRSYTLPNGRWETQLRDVALAGVLHLSGEDPKDFGFVNRERSEASVFQPDTLSFSGERERQMAFTKYYARFGQSSGGE